MPDAVLASVETATGLGTWPVEVLTTSLEEEAVGETVVPPVAATVLPVPDVLTVAELAPDAAILVGGGSEVPAAPGCAVGPPCVYCAFARSAAND